ncbi:hypothetical protein B5X24_HaOG210789 [Helicoverpa armigera]|nr:hypothetical protein B5X24_HaOG210789 [Helicoverpa armigera]
MTFIFNVKKLQDHSNTNSNQLNSEQKCTTPKNGINNPTETTLGDLCQLLPNSLAHMARPKRKNEIKVILFKFRSDVGPILRVPPGGAMCEGKSTPRYLV